MAARKQTPAAIAAKQRYEAAKKRPGTLVGARFSDSQLAAIDKARGDVSRSEFVKSAAIKSLAPRK